MKRPAFSFLFVLLFSNLVFGQIGGRKSFFELQFGAGPTFLLTDIGNFSYGGNIEVTGKYRLHQHIALKASIGGILGLGSGTVESNGTTDMEYYSVLAEITGQIEIYLLKEGRGYGKGGHMGYKPRIRPYLYAGGGPTFLFPKHTHKGAQELEEFDSFTVILLGGAGFVYRVNANIFWGFQAGPRFTTTDYLEGFSPGQNGGNDMYISAEFLLVYRF